MCPKINLAEFPRSAKDSVFIERATLDLFDIGFTCESTWETCSKSCHDLLSNVSHRHPFLISTLLRVLVWRPTKVRVFFKKSAKYQTSF